MRIKKRFTRLGELLVHAGVVNDDQLDVALKVQSKEGHPSRNIGDILIAMKFCKQADIEYALRKQHELRNGGMNIEDCCTESDTVETHIDEIGELADGILKKAKG